MNVLHRVRDVLELDGPTFFHLAYRLPAYEGAARVDLQAWIEDLQELEQQAIQEAEEAKYPPRYIDVSLDEMREKEGRVSMTPKAAFLEVEHEDRAATLEELRASGPAAPALGQMAPVFEIVKVTE